MPDQAILDFARPDAETGRRDHIVVAADKTDVTVFVHDTLVARRHPIADELGARCFGIVPVFEEHHRVRTPARNLPGLAALPLIARAVQYRHRVAGDALADRTGL